MDGLNPELMRGSLELMVLSVLADGSKYGYLIQQRLRDASDDRVELKAGTLYPILHKLETKKLVRSRWDDSTGRRRKWYELTAAGKKQLKVRVDEWQAYVECLRRVLGPLADPAPLPA
ncbi:MAG: helix-turn-helix transcriptional regulator [Rhodopirellula sp.]|nr:helix-turn-helix transcriptional regulator [Rhodopirellula sp.]